MKKLLLILLVASSCTKTQTGTLKYEVQTVGQPNGGHWVQYLLPTGDWMEEVVPNNWVKEYTVESDSWCYEIKGSNVNGKETRVNIYLDGKLVSTNNCYPCTQDTPAITKYCY